MQGHQPRENGVSVQDGYSLRAISQYHSVHFEKMKTIYSTIQTNMNSVSDNPLWAAPEHTTDGEEPWHWVSGANFLATHMADAMDSMRQVLCRIVKINDRHMARIVNQHMNNGLPANLSGPAALTPGVFKGVQIQAGMFDVYSTMLSMPVSTMFGVHEEGIEPEDILAATRATSVELDAPQCQTNTCRSWLSMVEATLARHFMEPTSMWKTCKMSSKTRRSHLIFPVALLSKLITTNNSCSNLICTPNWPAASIRVTICRCD
ncbi:MAG: aromatic amino acid lyase [Planctomycetales bacterium]|nr:aromatic amino acid lyase [Planctomycetales bacterium]